ncbi:MAG: porin family protein [Bacteroidales bacterium]|nr:porin family protein [Bacteroidales bacterium]
MKRLVLCLFAAASMLFATEGAMAQKINFGAKAGLNLSTWNVDDYEFKPGFHAGVYANIKINKMFAIQPEVLYSMEGVRFSEDETQTVLGKEYFMNLSATTTTHRLNVPVMFQITPLSLLTIEVGPQFGFNLAMKSREILETNVPGFPEYDETATVDSEVYNMFELGIAAGLKVNLAGNISLGARYVYGLTPLFGDVYDGFVEQEYGTSNLMISCSFGF